MQVSLTCTDSQVCSLLRRKVVTDALTLIATVHRAAQIAEGAFAEAMGAHNATARQLQVLAAIAGADQPHQNQLCELTGIDRSTLSVIC